MFNDIKDIDTSFFIFLNSLGAEKYDYFWISITQIYFWIPFYIILALILVKTFGKSLGKRIAMYAVFLLGVTILITESVRMIVGRIRPNNAGLEEVIRILQFPVNNSFFSGHAANSFSLTTFFVMLLCRKSKWYVLLYLWPLLFSYSRIYVGVHYPSDILVGSIVGVLLGGSAYKILKRNSLLNNPT
ncbi:hypothetical protein P278_19950 [Zhouia amylolytica AD3]|uniref:Phosphatidic acid phosphatase type 2/haloperoxidase domain-containing protein n=1 Tax=Zhouia amylolytica AD3 TaxID=1286632 RepID=W2UM59_9FLAO|nr:hypothetical protein P278_19950 [Zhouia amylolytica AD3]